MYKPISSFLLLSALSINLIGALYSETVRAERFLTDEASEVSYASSAASTSATTSTSAASDASKAPPATATSEDSLSFKSQFETARTLVRPMVPQDYDKVLEIWGDKEGQAMSGDYVTPPEVDWSTRRPSITSKDQYWEILNYCIVLKDTGRVIGSFQLAKVSLQRKLLYFLRNKFSNLEAVQPEEEWATVGYAVSKEFWGKGIMTEVANAGVEYGIKTLGLKLFGQTILSNIGSQRVLMKSGFVKIGQDEEHFSFEYKGPIAPPVKLEKPKARDNSEVTVSRSSDNNRPKKRRTFWKALVNLVSCVGKPSEKKSDDEEVTVIHTSGSNITDEDWLHARGR